MNTEQYFEILGIDRNMSPDEAKQAYKDLINRWYSDSKSDDIETRQKAEKKIKEINEAYEKVFPFFNDDTEETPKTRKAFILPVIIICSLFISIFFANEETIRIVVAFTIVLSVLVFFHELGHFMVARLCGVGVEKFSIGFGPRLIGKKIGITDYRISAIPLGGYVKMVGEDPEAEIDPADIPVSFTHKHVFKRISIVAAGPIFNFILAAVIFFFMYQISGMPMSKSVIGEVSEGTPAHTGGLEKGDMITAIDGVDIESWEDMSGIISKSKGKKLAISVQRDGSVSTFNIAPKKTTAKNIFNEDVERYVIGIVSSGDVFSKDLSVFEAVSASISKTYFFTELTVKSIVKLIQGRIPVKENLGGPIRIAKMSGQVAERGLSSLAFWIAILSINLAILNFLPIPVLDGGHLLFYSIELALRRPVNTKVREIAQQAGMLILFVLMAYVIFNDIRGEFFS
ncbi:MAG: RIP metalloprotease RseP [Desulfobacteraceae bacterium]|nr:RIP metalloprotease RseP [Desulfobacteraceae bacterium]